MIDFSAVIVDFEGAPIPRHDKTGESVTLEVVAISALMAPDERSDGKTKFDRYMLATKCKGCVELKVEEIALLKEQIGKVCVPLIVGRAWQMLDKAEGPEA